MSRRLQHISFFLGALNRPEFRFSEVLVPWILVVGGLGFLTAWLVVTILERTGLSRYVWHLPLFFAGLVVLLSSLIGMAVFP
jgi:predicted MFS family arabinose efflux permease